MPLNQLVDCRICRGVRSTSPKTLVDVGLYIISTLSVYWQATKPKPPQITPTAIPRTTGNGNNQSTYKYSQAFRVDNIGFSDRCTLNIYRCAGHESKIVHESRAEANQVTRNRDERQDDRGWRLLRRTQTGRREQKKTSRDWLW